MSAPSPAPETPRTDLERWAPLPPLVLVNTVAVYGQYAWAATNLPTVRVGRWDVPVWAVLFAAALESIAVYLSYEAHKARMAGDSSAKLWVAAYAVALLAGGLNYWHLAGPDHAPTPAAVAFAVMSTLSPWLWGIRSRSLHRDQLRDLGLIEARAVKFSTARWVLFPVATFQAFRAAVWAGETDPLAAVALLGKPSAATEEPNALSESATPTPDVSVTDTPAPPAAVKAAKGKAPAKAESKPAPSRERARTILMALRDFEAVPDAKLSRDHGGSDRFWAGAKDRLRGELAELTTEAGAL